MNWGNPQTIFIFIQSAIILVILACAIFFAQQERQRYEKLFEEIAKKRNGKVIKSSFLFDPKLSLDEFDIQTEIFTTPGGKNSPPHTHFQSQLRLPRNVRITIYRESPLSRIGKIFGVQDILTHEEAFDRCFIVKGSDTGFVLSLLTPEIRRHLLDWKFFYPRVTLDQGQFHMKIATRLREQERFDDFIATGLVILKKIAELG